MFGDEMVDLLASRESRDEYGVFFGRNINDDNEVGASLVPARIWDMTRANPAPDLQSYFQIGEWPVGEVLPLFKGTNGIMTAQALGLRKAISNVFLMLDRLQPRQLAATYPANPRINLVATASQDGERVAVLVWYHPSIKPYESGDTVTYDDLLKGLALDGIGPVTLTLRFQHLQPGTSYTRTLSVVDSTRSNSFTYRHAVFDYLRTNCGNDPSQWERACVYHRVGEINAWTLAEDGASVALETTTGSMVTNDQGQGKITLTANPYSVWLITLEPSTPR
jgi:hypothetical protein